MKKHLRWLAIALGLCCLVILAANAKAEPMRYLGVPVFYSKFVPKIAPCTINIPANYAFCGWANYPEEGEVGVTTASGKKEGWNIRLYDEVVCISGMCDTNYGEGRGSVLEPGVTYWYIPKGFYLTTLAGKTTAVKYGNGPEAKTFPIRDVVELPAEYNDQPDGTFEPVREGTYHVTCNPAKECNYLGRVFNYADLKQYIPPVLSTYCDLLFCYNPQQQIVGTNPKAP